jgi:lysyl-tRNA synthetase class 2
MLELYEAYGDYQSMMDLTEGLIVACVNSLGESMQLPYGDKILDFTPPWKRASYAALFQEHVGVSIDDAEGVSRAAEQTGFPTAGKHPDVIVLRGEG